MEGGLGMVLGGHTKWDWCEVVEGRVIMVEWGGDGCFGVGGGGVLLPSLGELFVGDDIVEVGEMFSALVDFIVSFFVFKTEGNPDQYCITEIVLRLTEP